MAQQISEEDLKQWERCFTPGTKAGYAGPEFVLRLIAAYRAQTGEIKQQREINASLAHGYAEQQAEIGRLKGMLVDYTRREALR